MLPHPQPPRRRITLCEYALHMVGSFQILARTLVILTEVFVVLLGFFRQKPEWFLD
jgi:hypothetical protein